MESQKRARNEEHLLCFYSESKDAPPCQGAREAGDPAEYPDLPLDFRKTLSNFYMSSGFVFDGHTYASIEHAYQGLKLYFGLCYGKLAPPEFKDTVSWRFTQESQDIATPREAKKNGRLVRLSKEAMKAWEERGLMKEIARAMYTQDAKARQVLLATNDARLYHIQPRKKEMVHFKHLEEIRDEFRNS